MCQWRRRHLPQFTAMQLSAFFMALTVYKGWRKTLNADHRQCTVLEQTQVIIIILYVCIILGLMQRRHSYHTHTETHNKMKKSSNEEISVIWCKALSYRPPSVSFIGVFFFPVFHFNIKKRRLQINAFCQDVWIWQLRQIEAINICIPTFFSLSAVQRFLLWCPWFNSLHYAVRQQNKHYLELNYPFRQRATSLLRLMHIQSTSKPDAKEKFDWRKQQRWGRTLCCSSLLLFTFGKRRIDWIS